MFITLVYIGTHDSEEPQASQLLHRKSVASAWWTCQIEKELSEENKRGYVFNGPNAQEKYMEEVDMKRTNSVYNHENCSDECKKRGQKISTDLVYTPLCFRMWKAVGY